MTEKNEERIEKQAENDEPKKRRTDLKCLSEREHSDIDTIVNGIETNTYLLRIDGKSQIPTHCTT